MAGLIRSMGCSVVIGHCGIVLGGVGLLSSRLAIAGLPLTAGRRLGLAGNVAHIKCRGRL